MPTWRLFDFA